MMSEQAIVLQPRVGAAAGAPPAIVGHRVELQLLTTLRCNLKCSYCSIAEGDVRESQGHVSYTMDQLDAFVAGQLADKEVYVTFYGGEPTLNRPFIEAVMQRHPLFRYQLQTNGTLLDDLSHHVLQRLSNVLVSIDGGQQVTDGYRGKGIYRQILRNIGLVRPSLGGTLTARVTWSDETIGFDELDELTRAFDYVYFQFVAGDAYGAGSIERRKAVLTQLVERFFADSDRVYPFIPLMGAVRNKLFPSRAVEQCGGGTACRVSTHILNVMPDGRIFACPDLMHLPEMQTGDVVGNWLRRARCSPTRRCRATPARRSPGAAATAWKNLYLGYVREDADWRAKVTDPICELVRHLGREIDRFDATAWFERLPLPQRRVLLDCEVYQYVEVMP
ncbi:MAG: radical SAM protein [Comamonadaceae bacterium]|nr:radical SAM protein [Comamonadaceae bacterium]